MEDHKQPQRDLWDRWIESCHKTSASGRFREDSKPSDTSEGEKQAAHGIDEYKLL